MFLGRYVNIVSKIRASLPPHVDKWGYSLKLLMGAVVGMGSLIGIYYHYHYHYHYYCSYHCNC